MRLPSIDLVLASAARTAARFPLVLATALVATVAAIAAIQSGTHPEMERLVATAALGLPLFFATTILAERSGSSVPVKWLAPLAGVAALVAFWALWNDWSSPIQALHLAQLAIAFHLLASLAPYMGRRGTGGFWQYNRILLLRFITAGIYSAVLFAGLAIALLAMNKLFGMHVPERSYAHLWLVIAFIFQSWFFLAGVPEDFAALERLSDYPAGLRVFTQYVLVPLVALYLTILTIYFAKVLLTRQWPNGWIGYLVSSVAGAGILSWLLVYPLEDDRDYAWVKTFTRGFYVALMPAIVMLWLAIYKRVAAYGVTEPRYFLIVLSVWLGGIAVWYTVTRSRNIKVIPASLCALALLTLAGPTGAYAVSRASQVGRLESILARNGLLENGRLRTGQRDVPLRDRREISGSLRYLLETHGASAFGAWLPDSIRRTLVDVPPKYGSEDEARKLMSALGLEYVARGTSDADTTSESFGFSSQHSRDAIGIAGYAYVLRLPYWNAGDSLKVGSDYMLRLSADSTSLQLSRGTSVALTIPLQAAVDSASAFRRTHGNAQVPPGTMRVEAGNGDVSALVYLTQLTGFRHAGGARVISLAGEIFLRFSR